VFGAVCVAIFPPIFCVLLTKNIHLTRAQNALDNKDLAGRPTAEPTDPERQHILRPERSRSTLNEERARAALYLGQEGGRSPRTSPRA
jgi:hypothetical protein